MAYIHVSNFFTLTNILSDHSHNGLNELYTIIIFKFDILQIICKYEHCEN
jgi:hypothetical protein